MLGVQFVSAMLTQVAFHMHASGADVRGALDEAMRNHAELGTLSPDAPHGVVTA